MTENLFTCGVVEGFYGRPWSAAQRGQLFAWMRDWGLNTYLYAPKDDPKHRVRWREPYHGGEAEELRRLISQAQNHQIRFIYALGPGLDFSYAAHGDLTCLKNKFSQLHELG